MNTRTFDVTPRKTLIAAAVAAALLVGCASAPPKPAGAAEVRNKLTQLQSDSNLASRAPVALKEAEAAVVAAETPKQDAQLLAHRIYMAERKVDTARAQAETRFAEDQQTTLSEQRETARLDARTREADLAKSQVETARAESAVQALSIQKANSEADVARTAALSSEQHARDLQQQIDELHAKPTDRGLVLTLGDVLFATGNANLKASATGNLNKLITFLNEYPDRTVIIEGYTDSAGTDDYNQELSQRRADSVKTYLITQGVGSARLSASGMGESTPIAGNDSAAGRQQNRRVEVIISNPPAASR